MPSSGLVERSSIRLVYVRSRLRLAMTPPAERADRRRHTPGVDPTKSGFARASDCHLNATKPGGNPARWILPLRRGVRKA
jgi:hypothetical protein